MYQNFPQRRTAADHWDPFAAHSFFDDVSLDVCEVLSQVRTPLPLDLFFKHLSIVAKQQLFLWQMQRVLALSGSYSLNLSVRMLTCLSWVTRLTKAGASGADCY